MLSGDIDNDTALQILRDLRRLKGWSVSEFSERLAINPTRASNLLNRGLKLQDFERRALATLLLTELEPEDAAYLMTRYERELTGMLLSPSPGARLARKLFTGREIEEFGSHSAELTPRRRYYVIRREADGALLISYLLMAEGVTPKLPMQYMLIRPGGAGWRVTRGVALHIGSDVYFFGRARSTRKMRLMTLAPVTHRTRVDLYGLRLGHSVDTGRPSAYPVYLYHTISGRPRLEIESLLGRYEPGDAAERARLSAAIRNLTDIEALLDIHPGDEGLSTKAVD